MKCEKLIAFQVNGFLRTALATSPLGVHDLEAKARALGLLREDQSITHSKPFKEAKNVLGVRSLKNGFGTAGKWLWVLDKGPTVRVTETLERSEFTTPLDGKAGSKREHLVADTLWQTQEAPQRIPGEWLKGVTILERQAAPSDVPPHRWRQFVADCHNFINARERSAERASSLGWNALSLFGCHPTRPLAHLSNAGLLWMVNGGRLVEVHRNWAMIEPADNSSQRIFDRRPRTGANVPCRGCDRVDLDKEKVPSLLAPTIWAGSTRDLWLIYKKPPSSLSWHTTRRWGRIESYRRYSMFEKCTVSAAVLAAILTLTASAALAAPRQNPPPRINRPAPILPGEWWQNKGAAEEMVEVPYRGRR